MQITKDDIRSAVAAGVISESQAASTIALAEARAGRRRAIRRNDEPFEFFRGFAEIFVSIGLVLLISGILAFTSVFGGFLTPALAAFLCWTFARYFTIKRRMSLPSIVLVTGFALGSAAAIALALTRIVPYWQNDPLYTAGYFVLIILALAFWYRSYRVPFTMFLGGLAVMGLIFVLTGSLNPAQSGAANWSSMFDLRDGSGLALGTLIFGIIAFAAGLYFDMRDPYRIGRWSACGFWLHILAAPAIVNTVALSAYTSGDVVGKILLAVVLAIVAVLALIIDRRSFLTAGIVYLGILVAWVVRFGDEAQSFALVMVILGAILTAMGSFWSQLRSILLQALPEFPGKSRLPPYVLTR